jgi:hypothetical protein
MSVKSESYEHSLPPSSRPPYMGIIVNDDLDADDEEESMNDTHLLKGRTSNSSDEDELTV